MCRLELFGIFQGIEYLAIEMPLKVNRTNTAILKLQLKRIPSRLLDACDVMHSSLLLFERRDWLKRLLCHR